MKKIQKKAKLNGNNTPATGPGNNNNCSGAESGNSCSSGGLLQSAVKDEQCSQYNYFTAHAIHAHAAPFGFRFQNNTSISKR